MAPHLSTKGDPSSRQQEGGRILDTLPVEAGSNPWPGSWTESRVSSHGCPVPLPGEIKIIKRSLIHQIRFFAPHPIHHTLPTSPPSCSPLNIQGDPWATPTPYPPPCHYLSRSPGLVLSQLLTAPDDSCSCQKSHKSPPQPRTKGTHNQASASGCSQPPEQQDMRGAGGSSL